MTETRSVGLPSLPTELAAEPVVLTPHPLQRCGAFAIAVMAGVDHPCAVDESSLGGVWKEMTEDLVGVAGLHDAKQPGGFWLSVSYMLWPNSKMNTTNRKKLTPQQRAEATRAWRTVPEVGEWPGAPCVLCGRQACGFFGKVDVPLAGSVEYLNTTVPGHGGVALCVGCLASFYALPYGCLVHSGRLSVVHSWDEEFLAAAIRNQLEHTRRQASWGEAPVLPAGGFEREQLVVDLLRRYRGRKTVTSGVSLLVFTNSNKKQEFTEHSLSQSLISWLRTTALWPRRAAAWSQLERACGGRKVSGQARLARLLVAEPHRVPRTIASTVHEAVDGTKPPRIPAAAVGLYELLSSFLYEVMKMPEQHVHEIEQLGVRAAELIIAQSEPLKKFTVAYRRPGDLRRWVNAQSVAWLTAEFARQREPFITPRQLKLLFEFSDQAWLYRNLFFTAVIAELHRRGYATDPEDAASARKGIETEDGEEL
ncbi:hypothetical protein GCM10011581_35360 [Saccharopolyspora subtropica]|uniref:Type I-B CRISPR-associated protein Cas8b1/Cst1 n=1 Tax=Saccharopolyspora thermophila TaxID=89367 RepID=A0A917K051_9PSEU|nr:hypothetical protein [Saccharopolyspora subtropica]GGI95184.1 hypothetical protein GCM10011581_35360 [Saccharopolyspora subtropica]